MWHYNCDFFFFAVRSSDKRIACDEEFSDSEDEGEGGRRNVANFKKAKRAKTEEEKEEDKKGAAIDNNHIYEHNVHYIANNI